MIRTSLVFSLLLSSPVSASAQTAPFAKLDCIRQVQVAPPTDGEPEWEVAGSGNSPMPGGWIRTRRRSFAEVRPNAGGSIRIDEGSSFRLRPDGTAVRLAPFSGRLYADSTKAIVQTNGFTVDLANARAEITASSGNLVVRVLEGKVFIVRSAKQWTASSGESIAFRFSDGPLEVDGPNPISPVERAVARPGDGRAWWSLIDRERNLAVYPGSDSAWSERSNPLTEYVSQLASIPPDPRAIALNPSDRTQLLRIARESIVPTLERDLDRDPNLTLAGYSQRFGNQFVKDRFPVGGTDLKFLLDRGIGNVRQAFSALDAAGASLGIDVRGVPTRSVWRASSWTAAPNPEFRLFDGSQRNGGISAAAIALGALLERRSLTSGKALFGGSVFGISSDPQAFGGRAEGMLDLPSTRIRWESNAIRLMSGTASGTYLSGDSVVNLERYLGPGRSIWMGRKRFADGPVYTNFLNGQLLANRFTGFGARNTTGTASTEFGWLADANADAMGNQSGVYATHLRAAGAGRIGARFLSAGGLRPGIGATFSGAYPVVRGGIDGYAEVGRGPDGATLSTFGAYFPGIFQNSGTDLHIEVARHSGIGQGIHVHASHSVAADTVVRAYATVGRDGLDRSIAGGGFALLKRFGTL